MNTPQPRIAPSGPLSSAGLSFQFALSGSPAAGSKLTLAKVNESASGISVVDNRLVVSLPGWYLVLSQVSLLQAEDVEQYVRLRTQDTLQGQTTEYPLNDGGTTQGYFTSPLIKLFHIDDLDNQHIEFVNISAAGIEVQSTSSNGVILKVG